MTSSANGGQGAKGDSAMGTLASLVGWGLRIGLVGGLLFGCGQTLALGYPWRHMMELPEWVEVLTYSGSMHAVIGAICGIAVAVPFCLVAVCSHRIRERIVPGAVGIATFVACMSSLAVWTEAAYERVAGAYGITFRWLFVIVIWWITSLVSTYFIARLAATRGIGRFLERLCRALWWPTVALVCVSLGVQWFERVRSPGTTFLPDHVRAHTSGSSSRPNVLLVVLDTQRSDRLGCYGYGGPTSPRLDAFAEDAVVFENCLASGIWTIPSHASIFTGLFLSEHGTTGNHLWLNSSCLTLAEYLKSAGYETIAFVNNPIVSDQCNLLQGFDTVLRPERILRVRGGMWSEFVSLVLYPAGLVNRWVGMGTEEDKGGRYTARLARRWLEGRDPNRPFFVFFNYMESHGPLRPHMAYRKLFVEPKNIGLSYTLDTDKAAEFSLLKQDCYSPHQIGVLNGLYDACVRTVDDSLGDMLEVVSQHVCLDDTLVIVTADHGENLGDHHMLDHAWCVYDTLAHVPMIVRYPKRLAPGRVSTLVQLPDVFPTILDAVQDQPPGPASTFARSLFEFADAAATSAPGTQMASAEPAKEDRRHGAVIELLGSRGDARVPDPRFDRTPYLQFRRALRSGRWKYVRFGIDGEKLYDIDKDPTESFDIHQDCPNVCRQLQTELESWLQEVQRHTPTKPSQSLDGSKRYKELQRSLRGLGYVQ